MVNQLWSSPILIYFDKEIILNLLRQESYAFEIFSLYMKNYNSKRNQSFERYCEESDYVTLLSQIKIINKSNYMIRTHLAIYIYEEFTFSFLYTEIYSH